MQLHYLNVPVAAPTGATNNAWTVYLMGQCRWLSVKVLHLSEKAHISLFQLAARLKRSLE